MPFLRNIKQLVVILVIPALVVIYYNHAANWHFHLLGSGQVIEHAHPYEPNSSRTIPVSEHNHTGTDLIYLDIIFQLIVLIVAFFGMIIPVLNRVGQLVHYWLGGAFKPDSLTIRAGRAPPRPVS